MLNNETIIYRDGELELPVEVGVDKETVWLNRNQLAILFDRDVKTIGKHINNALKEEMDNSVVAKFATTASDGKIYNVDYYNLDMIISVGYRVKSNRGIAFRKWATSILKEYIVQGYAVNEKRLKALNRVVEIQSNIIANVLEIDLKEVFSVVQKYTQALELLDNYDHQRITKPDIIKKAVYQLTYEECRELIASMSFGEDAYPSIQEKAANLLYFIVKDHPFIDGCKRIAASIFLYFLNQNNLLFRDGKKIISDSTLVAITLLLAESKPEEKEIMVNVIMNFLEW